MVGWKQRWGQHGGFFCCFVFPQFAVLTLLCPMPSFYFLRIEARFTCPGYFPAIHDSISLDTCRFSQVSLRPSSPILVSASDCLSYAVEPRVSSSFARLHSTYRTLQGAQIFEERNVILIQTLSLCFFYYTIIRNEHSYVYTFPPPSSSNPNANASNQKNRTALRLRKRSKQRTPNFLSGRLPTAYPYPYTCPYPCPSPDSFASA